MREIRAASRVSDGELVQRTLLGNAKAFDVLVMRHREAVLNLACYITGNRDQAEDVAQQAFLEALSGLRGLRQDDRFRPWLMTIVRRCACRKLRDTRRPEVEFNEAVLYPWTPLAVPAELRYVIESSLAELSARNRAITVLHYLEGYSCKEIGKQLGIPAGTVMRILHESRESLRKTIGIASEKGDVGRMTTEDKPDVAKTGPRNLVCWLHGSGRPVSSILQQTICLVANKRALTMEQIADITKADEGYVREEVQALVAEDLLVECSGGCYRANFLALDGNDWIELTGDIRKHGIRFADALQGQIPAIEEAWSRTRLPGEGYSWDANMWLPLAVLLCGIGLVRMSPLSLLMDPPLHGSGHRYWIGAHEAVPEEHLVWAVGFNCRCEKDNLLDYGHFHTWGLPRERFMINEDCTRVMTALARGVCDPAAIAAEVCLTPEHIRVTLAELIEIGAVRKVDGVLSLAFPVLESKDSEILTPIIDAAMQPLYRDNLEPMTAGMADRLRQLGYGHMEDQFPIWRSWVQNFIAGEGLRELLTRGVLPDPGHPAPAVFCLVGWFNGLPIMAWRKC